jgi:hypothetical protein
MAACHFTVERHHQVSQPLDELADGLPR